jgi:hypothetical protein
MALQERPLFRFSQCLSSILKGPGQISLVGHGRYSPEWMKFLCYSFQWWTSIRRLRGPTLHSWIRLLERCSSLSPRAKLSEWPTFAASISWRIFWSSGAASQTFFLGPHRWQTSVLFPISIRTTDQGRFALRTGRDFRGNIYYANSIHHQTVWRARIFDNGQVFVFTFETQTCHHNSEAMFCDTDDFFRLSSLVNHRRCFDHSQRCFW